MSKSLVFNKIPIEEIEIGMSVNYSQTITDADIKAFSGISGDRNPIHLNEEYAEGSQYKKRIAHGLMTASYFSALFGTKIPGEGCVYVSQSLNFKKPIYINDTVVAIVTVTDVDLAKRRVFFRTICKVNNKVVTDGEAELYVPLEFTKILISNKSELKQYTEKIFQLFENCFNQAIDECFWNWAYLDNPNGDPIVSLYFDGDKLVGHYAVVPIKLAKNNKSIPVVLSMTTMVDLSYRKYGIFIIQANDVYDKAKALGYKAVIGFPNKKSAPGFKKRLNWVLEENLYVAKLNYSELQMMNRKSSVSDISFNIEDKTNIQWRLNKPSNKYITIQNNILKKYKNEYDIVYSGEDFSKLDKGSEYNIVIDCNFDKYLDKKVFDYIFGYKLFDPSLENSEFKKDLIISDVF